MLALLVAQEADEADFVDAGAAARLEHARLAELGERAPEPLSARGRVDPGQRVERDRAKRRRRLLVRVSERGCEPPNDGTHERRVGCEQAVELTAGQLGEL